MHESVVSEVRHDRVKADGPDLLESNDQAS